MYKNAWLKFGILFRVNTEKAWWEPHDIFFSGDESENKFNQA